MVFSDHVSVRSLILVGCASLLLTAGAARADLEDFGTDLGRFATWDSDSGTLTATYDGGGGMMVLSAGTTGSNVGVEHYSVQPDTYYMVTVDVTVQAGGTDFVFEVGLRSGSYTASDFDSNPGSWFIPGKWESGASIGDDTQWPETENTKKVIGMSILSGPSDTTLSLGFKLGGSDAPDVHIDNVHITRPNAAVTYTFDEEPYITFDYVSYGWHYDGFQGYDGSTTPDVTLDGVLPGTPTGIQIWVPHWMTGGVGLGDTTGATETVTVYDGNAWRMDNDGGSFDDGSPVIPLTTEAGTVYTLNFWMVRDRSEPGNSWVSWDPYSTHVAWRLTDDPWPIDIEGYSGGSLQADAFHLACEDADMAERNYAPDIYAPELTPGNLRSVDCVDPEGSRYSTMAFQAVDDTSWFEMCIRGNRGQTTGRIGTSTWILDDLRLFVHGEESLVEAPPTVTPTLSAGVDSDAFETYR